MTLLDGDLTRGWLRERRVLKEVMRLYVLKHSPLVRNYIAGIARVTGLSEVEVEKSLPVRNLVKRVLGFD